MFLEVKKLQHPFFAHFIRMPFFLRIFIIALVFIVSFGFLAYIIEPETFPNLFEGIWWAIMTVSTVGYGDFVPSTILGKITGMVLVLSGAGFVSSYFVTLATTTVKRQNNLLEGKVMFKGTDHYIIVGWNERARAIIDKLLTDKEESSIILIDQTLETNPFSDYHVHFIKGRANTDEILIKANIYHAKKVMITADQNLDELHADMNSIIALLAIKGLSPNVVCVVEILTEEQVANAKRAGADEVIQSNIISGSVMTNCLHSTGTVDALIVLLEQFDGTRFVFRSATSHAGKSFIETSKTLLDEGALLFGIKRGADTIVNPPHPFKIKDNDMLLVVDTLE